MISNSAEINPRINSKWNRQYLDACIFDILLQPITGTNWRDPIGFIEEIEFK